MTHPFSHTQQEFTTEGGRKASFFSLPELERSGAGPISRLPICLRIVLESLLRNCDGRRVTERDVLDLAGWQGTVTRTAEIPFIVARVLLQDFTGVPLLVDLAAMRDAAAARGASPELIEPLVPVELVVDHSVQVDFSSSPDALRLNSEMEFKRNATRYRFLKWGTQAFRGFQVIPPEIGICHQVNLEYLSRGVFEKDGLVYPDSVVGTDSHTTMVNGLGIVGWGVGGIEAEAAMLGQPIALLSPDVIGVHLSGALREGVTATDLVLRVTELLRRINVVGKFVEFHGEGAASLSVPDRATIGNMAPEYGATMGYFPVDEESCRYLRATGRPDEQVDLVRGYFQAQGMFGISRLGQCDYSALVQLDLSTIEPSVAGPRRPQDRIPLGALKEEFTAALLRPTSEKGYGKSPEALTTRYPVRVRSATESVERAAGGGEQAEESVPQQGGHQSEKDTSALTEIEMMNNRPTPDRVGDLLPDSATPEDTKRRHRADARDVGHGDVLIAAITSCTNTSNPSVMLAAGLLAKKAVERGLRAPSHVKRSLAPGSRVVTDYLAKTGLQPFLDALGFHLVGYGCTTCIGNSGPLEPAIENAVAHHDVIAASVLSGNRNFEARVHQALKANFLMSPPLVVAFALAGTVNIDLSREPLGQSGDGRDVYLRDIWPTSAEIAEAAHAATDPEVYRRLYAGAAELNPLWNEIPSVLGRLYRWNPDSSYIQRPPYFDESELGQVGGDITGARLLAVFGDSVTTDHISPAGSIPARSPAGRYLQDHGIEMADFNSYGARRGNHHVMVRGTFANIRIRNLIAPGTEGGVTRHQPSGKLLSIFDAATEYRGESTPLLIIAGREYGTGSSRDWAAKGTRLLGVRAVIAESFERIHRSNLVGMGVLPCQFMNETTVRSLGLDGTEMLDLSGLAHGLQPRQPATLTVRRRDGRTESLPLLVRLDTPMEVEYFRSGGILPYVLNHLQTATAV